MNSMFKGGIILIIALMAATYFMAGDAFSLGEDYINDLTMLGAFAIIAITVFVALKYINQIKNDTASGELVEDNWDGIGEYTNDIPVGWGVIFIGTIVWMFWYMFVGYPTNQFSQVGQYNEEVNEYNVKFQSQWDNPTADTLKAMGESVFGVQCAPCHGVDAEGIAGKAQDLTQRISKEQVLTVIQNGQEGLGYAMGAMPAGMASGADAEAIATWVVGGMKGEKPASFVACASCHGEDGKGMNGMSPNLAEYDVVLMAKVIENGKKSSIGEMPSFKGRINETQTKALSAFLNSIKAGE
ncbi:cytochrome C oxidase subunit III [Sulfurovum sp. bin170]|uniref:c-type cytochrome n=1 Tax=Sulfurovum sp. bin170 TaxID=2695268 RepID=UPI0013DFE453|nr:c-type cytochrome [Sulfurovum sp. bin170]NEW61093.1 cytochrome C oxidase subunit III [Sulfurovum sp. bin170]